MFTLPRRMLLILALMIWQGGFIFYGAVVVPLGAQVLGSHQVQGFISQRVTEYLNWIGVVALLVWGWDLMFGSRVGRPGRWALWLLIAALLGALFWLHPQLDEYLDSTGLRVLERRTFKRWHRAYLIVSTVQWAAAMWLIGWTLRDWRRQDLQVKE